MQRQFQRPPFDERAAGHCVRLDPERQRDGAARVDLHLVTGHPDDRHSSQLQASREQAVGLDSDRHCCLQRAEVVDTQGFLVAEVNRCKRRCVETAHVRCIDRRLGVASVDVDVVLLAARRDHRHLHPQHGQFVDAVEAFDAELERRLVVTGHHAQVGAVFLGRHKVEVTSVQAHGHGHRVRGLLGLQALGGRVQRHAGALRPVLVPPGACVQGC